MSLLMIHVCLCVCVLGFIGMLVEKLWCVLEGQPDADDYKMTAPRSHPLDPLDRAAHKVKDSYFTFQLLF